MLGRWCRWCPSAPRSAHPDLGRSLRTAQRPPPQLMPPTGRRVHLPSCRGNSGSSRPGSASRWEAPRAPSSSRGSQGPCWSGGPFAKPPGPRPTVDVGWDLPEDGEVRLVHDPPEDPVHAALVVNEDGLLGHPEGHNPHGQQEEEEEDVLHLRRQGTGCSRSRPPPRRRRTPPSRLRPCSGGRCGGHPCRCLEPGAPGTQPWGCPRVPAGS